MIFTHDLIRFLTKENNDKNEIYRKKRSINVRLLGHAVRKCSCHLNKCSCHLGNNMGNGVNLFGCAKRLEHVIADSAIGNQTSIRDKILIK